MSQETASMLISKVKFGKTPSNHWVFHKVGDPLESKTSTWASGAQYKEARTSLWDALRAFDAIAADMMDAPPEWAFDLSAIGVSIVYKLSETSSGGVALNRGLVVTALKPLKDHNGPMVINTACLFEYEFGKEDSGQRTLPHVATLAMDRIIDEAEAYLRGEYSDSEPIQTSLLTSDAALRPEGLGASQLTSDAALRPEGLGASQDLLASFHETVNAPSISGVTVSIPSAEQHFDVTFPEGAAACLKAVAKNLKRKRERTSV
jgi:hypothetical protein